MPVNKSGMVARELLIKFVDPADVVGATVSIGLQVPELADWVLEDRWKACLSWAQDCWQSQYMTRENSTVLV